MDIITSISKNLNKLNIHDLVNDSANKLTKYVEKRPESKTDVEILMKKIESLGISQNIPKTKIDIRHMINDLLNKYEGIQNFDIDSDSEDEFSSKKRKVEQVYGTELGYKLIGKLNKINTGFKKTIE